MVGRLALAAFVLGAAWVHIQPGLPSTIGLGVVAAVVLAMGAACVGWQKSGARRGAVGLATRWVIVAAAALLGVAYTTARAQWRLDDMLSCQHHNRVVQMVVRVVSLPQGDASSRRFDVEVVEPLAPVAGLPRAVRVMWRAPPRGVTALPEVKPGQVWRMALHLRRPRAARNPFAQDGESRLFAQGVRATGSVRGRPVLQTDEVWSSPWVAIQRLRHMLRARMLASVGDLRYGPVIVALALGDQSGIKRDDWTAFNRTGVTHLVAISGLHVGLVAGAVGWCAGGCYRRLRWRGVPLPERWPVQPIMAGVALVVAGLYCVLAGWGIPARRVWVMLSILAAAVAWRVAVSPPRLLLTAAAAVTVMDPWAPLSMGFWLSFGAVGTLMMLAATVADRAPSKTTQSPVVESSSPDCLLVGAEEDEQHTRVQRLRAIVGVWWIRFTAAAWLQISLNLALMPALIYLVRQVSVISPVANAVAIPIVGLVVTPLALLTALLCGSTWTAPLAGWVAWLAHQPLSWTLDIVHALASPAWVSVPTAAVPIGWVALAGVGVVWGLTPRGLPGRVSAWTLLLPALCWRPALMAPGEWRAVALDVGQAGAVVITTRHHTVVFDTGLRFEGGGDAGERVISPYFQAIGRGRVDRLVVSHEHLDHMGGVRGIMARMDVSHAHAPFDLNRYLHHEAGRYYSGEPARGWPLDQTPCQRGMSWTYDGVTFRFVHPPPDHTYTLAQANASSCVLVVTGGFHRVVLPGDIGAREEQQAVSEVGVVDVVLASHHGSATSSSTPWIRGLKPRHVIAQAGYLNRFAHPAKVVQDRWRMADAWFWRTDLDGAVEIVSSAGGLSVGAWRDRSLRYWHDRLDYLAGEPCGKPAR